MGEFRVTNYWGLEKNRHNHLVYLDEKLGVGYASFDDKHTHRIFFIPPTEQQFDEFGNIVAEASPGGWVVEPSADGHTHEELEQYQTNYRLPKEPKEKVLAEIIELFKEALEIEAKAKKDANESEDFYCGKQWSSSDKQYLEALDRACLTINEVERGIDTLYGIYKENRSDFQYSPQEGTDQKTCDLFNILKTKVLQECNSEQEEEEVFLEQIKRGRGWFNLYVSMDDLQGKIVVEKFNDCDVFPGPHEKKDASDLEYVFKTKMYSLGKICNLFPNKAKELQGAFNQYNAISAIGLDEEEGEEKDHVQFANDHYGKSNNTIPVNKIMPSIISGDTVVDIARKNFKLLECQRKVYIPASVIVKIDTQESFPGAGWYPKDIKRVRQIVDATTGAQIFETVEQHIARMRVTKIAGGVILVDEYPADLPDDDFYIIPVYAKKSKNYYWGKIHPVKDPQREVNKRHSQLVDIGNKMCAYGYFFDSMTFDDPAVENQFKQMVSSPGFAVKVNNINNRPVKEEGVKFPSEIAQLLEMDARKITEILNISVEPGGANESFAHLMQRTKAKVTGNQYLFDNLKVAKMKLGKLLIGLIQKYWSVDRVKDLLSSEDPEAIQLDGTPIDEFTDEQLEQILMDENAARLDVIVTEIDPSPTTRMMTYMLLETLASKGQPVPPEMLIEAADIPVKQKDKMIAGVQQANDLAAEQARTTGDVEIEKTLIAKGVIPPSVTQRMGLDPNAQQQMNAAAGAPTAQLTSPAGGIVQQGDAAMPQPRRTTKRVYTKIEQDPETGQPIEVATIESEG
jgi:hypothetical protein